MRTLLIPMFTAGAVLAGCAYPAPPPPDPATAAAAYQACGTYGYVDRNSDGWVDLAEYNAWRAGGYGYWDIDRDGRISRDEFRNCWYGGGFYASNSYNRDYWTNYWTAFDANNDGWLSSDEYWSAAAWARMDRNNNGRIDADEYRWW